MNTSAIQFTPLDLETRTVIPTAEAAHHLNRAPQTLRIWASLQTGVLKPVHIGRRLGWKVTDIKALLNGGV